MKFSQSSKLYADTVDEAPAHTRTPAQTHVHTLTNTTKWSLVGKQKI